MGAVGGGGTVDGAGTVIERVGVVIERVTRLIGADRSGVAVDCDDATGRVDADDGDDDVDGTRTAVGGIGSCVVCCFRNGSDLQANCANCDCIKVHSFDEFRGDMLERHKI